MAVGTGLGAGVGIAATVGTGVARRLVSPIAGKIAVGAGVGSGCAQPTAMLVNRLAMPSARNLLMANSLWFVMTTHHGPGKYARDYTKCFRPPWPF